MKKYKVKDDFMNESDLRKPGGSILTTEKGFVSIDNSSLGGTHWTCFHTKNHISFHFVSLGGQPDKLISFY